MYGENQNLMKAWHYADLPDAREIAKNDYIDSLQGNRNPFIDSVNYACYIDFNNMTKVSGPIIPCNASTIGLADHNPNKIQMALWPNPSDGSFTLFYQTKESETIIIRLIDTSGRVVLEQSNKVELGATTFSLDFHKIAKGIYTLQLQGANTINETLILN